ncbi:arylamine N-acetyltransferase [Streptomyces sp. NPDC050504]|uniref:arylamine N-acetyltransferase n=1 Tax=Streptomyces sp. NPDC050504 TaxID=3365618 RepID=UPI0037B550CD
MWSGEELDLDAYLRRIGYGGNGGAEEPVPDLETLRALHRAHVAAIPFENLEVALGRPVPLDLKSLQAKLVGRRRGGYCYEQNSLFAAALERIGFAVEGRGARNRTRGTALLPVTHALLVVTVDGEPWLCDTGFGAQGILEPVPLRAGVRVEQGAWSFGIEAEDEGILVLRTLRPEGWVDLYAFAPQRLYPGDFTVMNHYSSTHPRSSFVGQVVVQRPGERTRVRLVRDELTVTSPDGARELRRVPEGELVQVLDSVFGIELDAEDRAQLVRAVSAGA